MRITYYSITIFFLLSNVLLFAQDGNQEKYKQLYSMFDFKKANYKENCTEEFDEKYYDLLSQSGIKSKNKEEYKKISDLKSKNVKSCERIKLMKDQIASFEASDQDILRYPIKYLNQCNSYISDSKNFEFTDNIHFSYCLHVFVSISSTSLQDKDKDFCSSIIKFIDEILSPFNSNADEQHNFSIKSDKYIKNLKEKCDLQNLNEKIKKLSLQGYLSDNVEQDVKDLKAEIKDIHEKHQIDNYDEINDFFNNKFIDLKIYNIDNKKDEADTFSYFMLNINQYDFLLIHTNISEIEKNNRFFILDNLFVKSIKIAIKTSGFLKDYESILTCPIDKKMLYTGILDRKLDCFKDDQKLSYSIYVGSYFAQRDIPLVKKQRFNIGIEDYHAKIQNKKEKEQKQEQMNETAKRWMYETLKFTVRTMIPFQSYYNIYKDIEFATKMSLKWLNNVAITANSAVTIYYYKNQKDSKEKDTIRKIDTIDVSRVNTCWKNALLGNQIGTHIILNCPSNVDTSSTYDFDILILEIKNPQ